MTDEIYLVLFEVLLGMLVLFMVGNNTCIKRVVQCLNLKALFDVRSSMSIGEKISKSMHADEGI